MQITLQKNWKRPLKVIKTKEKDIYHYILKKKKSHSPWQMGFFYVLKPRLLANLICLIKIFISFSEINYPFDYTN